MTAARPAIGSPGRFVGYDAEQAARFAAVWLPAWTGNDPQRLASFETEDTFYSDPHVPAGIRAREDGAAPPAALRTSEA